MGVILRIPPITPTILCPGPFRIPSGNYTREEIFPVITQTRESKADLKKEMQDSTGQVYPWLGTDSNPQGLAGSLTLHKQTIPRKSELSGSSRKVSPLLTASHFKLAAGLTLGRLHARVFPLDFGPGLPQDTLELNLGAHPGV